MGTRDTKPPHNVANITSVSASNDPTDPRSRVWRSNCCSGVRPNRGHTKPLRRRNITDRPVFSPPQQFGRTGWPVTHERTSTRWKVVRTPLPIVWLSNTQQERCRQSVAITRLLATLKSSWLRPFAIDELWQLLRPSVAVVALSCFRPTAHHVPWRQLDRQ